MTDYNLGKLAWSDDEGAALVATGCGVIYRREVSSRGPHGVPATEILTVEIAPRGCKIDLGEMTPGDCMEVAVADHFMRVALCHAARSDALEEAAKLAGAYARECVKAESRGEHGAFERGVGAMDVLTRIRALKEGGEG